MVAPWCEGSEAFDGSVPFEVVRERQRFVWPSPGVAVASSRRTLVGDEVVLFGDAFPLALMGSVWQRGGCPTLMAHGFDFWLSTMPVTTR